MRPSFFARRFLARLQVTGMQYENPRVERVLAVSRVSLGVTALIVDLTHPLTPEPYNQLLILLLMMYCIQNLGFLIWMIMNAKPTSSFIRIAQASDVFWPIVLCLFADPPSSLVFIFFLFALMTAAFRFGMHETVLTALGCTIVLVVQESLVWMGPQRLGRLIYTEVGMSRLLLRSGFLLMSGFLLGYLAEREKELRAEIGLTNHLLSLTRVGNRLGEVVTEVSAELAKGFFAKHAFAVVCQAATNRYFRWDITLHPERSYQIREIRIDDQASDMMTRYPDTFFLRKTGEHSKQIDAIDDEGRRVDASQLEDLPMPVLGANSVLALRMEVGREWSGRFVFFDAITGWDREHELRFAQNAMRQVAPALYSIYLFRRLRSRAGAMERARVARELHDTAIQSLISIEMQVDVLKRTSNGKTQTVELERIQQLLREEVLNLRALMQSMRPVEIGPHQFLDFIAQIVERFRSDTGLNAQFVSELEEVTLPAQACRELARVVQEGLVNVRKHSRARSVYVRFGAQNGLWKLIIDDDGQGFPFSGRLTMGELDNLHRGPTVIKERVRTIGGDMVIESSPGHGSRLEITVPQKGYEFYG